MEINKNRPKLINELIIRDLDKSLLHSEKGKIYEFNNTAFEILKMCSGNYTEDEIGRHIAEKYGIKKEEAMSDVKNVVSRLRKDGLVW
ncbi:MAG: PqqD family protein [Actinobacteria bacterium]|nr:PqqD family protein [Actinomycetota bacterium]MCG2717277.1 PqqD family protein [Nanoarchaeota archaeon]